LFLSGWGKLNYNMDKRSRFLKSVRLPLISNQKCIQWYVDNNYQYTELDIIPGMMCAGYEGGGRDACLGDSGGECHGQADHVKE
jgi:secreted trypsin-like serine protease